MKKYILIFLLIANALLFIECADNAPSPSNNQLIIHKSNGSTYKESLTTSFYNNPDPNKSGDLSGYGPKSTDYEISLAYPYSYEIGSYNGNARFVDAQFTISNTDTIWTAISGNMNVVYTSAQFLKHPESISLTFSDVQFTNYPTCNDTITASGYVYSNKTSGY